VNSQRKRVRDKSVAGKLPSAEAANKTKSERSHDSLHLLVSACMSRSIRYVKNITTRRNLALMVFKKFLLWHLAILFKGPPESPGTEGARINARI